MFLLSIRMPVPIPFERFKLVEIFWNQVVTLVKAKHGEFGALIVESFPQKRKVKIEGISEPVILRYEIKREDDLPNWKHLVLQTRIKGIDKNINGTVETMFTTDYEPLGYLRSIRSQVERFGKVGCAFDRVGNIFIGYVGDKSTNKPFDELYALSRRLEAHKRAVFIALRKLGVDGIIPDYNIENQF